MIPRLVLFFSQAAFPIDTSPLPNPTSSTFQGEVKDALDIVFTITGGIALLVVTLAGFRYILSRGEPQATAQAKDAILYALVGLVVSITAITIVNFVIRNT